MSLIPQLLLFVTVFFAIPVAKNDFSRAGMRVTARPFVAVFLLLSLVLQCSPSIVYSEAIPRPFYNILAALKYGTWPRPPVFCLQSALLIAIFVINKKKSWPLVFTGLFIIFGFLYACALWMFGSTETCCVS